MLIASFLAIFTLLTAPGFECPEKSDNVAYAPIKKKIDILAKGAEKKKAAILKKTSPYDFPWLGLEEYLEKEEMTEIYIIGYGSLINQNSSARTLKEQPEPVLAFGVDRIFNYNRKLESLTKGEPSDPKMRANLNVRINADFHHVVNGVAFKVPLDEIQNLRDRETGYDLVPVIAISWNAMKNAPTKSHYFLAYILTVPDGTILYGERLTDSKILPYLPYYNLTREGASSYGEDFLQVYLNTTFLSDGKTTIAEWEKKGCPPSLVLLK